MVIRGNLSYTLTVKNNGLSNVTGATVIDNLPAGLTGATWTCVASGSSSCPASGSGSINASVNMGVGAANQVVFTVTGTVAANAPNPMSNTATVAVPAAWVDSVSANNTSSASVVVNAPDLTIAKSHTPDPMARGSSSGVYSITVSNVGTAATLTNPSFNTVTITDTLPTGLTPTAATGTGWTCAVSGQTVTCTRNDSLSAGSSYPIIQVPVTVAQTVPASLTNTATVAGGGEANLANDTANDPTNFVSQADLSLTKTVSDATPAIGNNITYTLTLTNAGPTATTGVTVKDLLPSGLTFVSSTPSQGTYDSGLGVWTVGNLNVTSVTLTINAQVNAAGTIINKAEVSASSVTDPDSTPADGVGDDAASVSITTRVPDVTITKTHTGNFTRGSSGIYTLTATNSGTATTNTLVTVTDTLPTGLTPSSATGTGWTCSISGQTVSCSRSDALTASSSYPDIALTVVVAQDAAANLTNTAAVAGGGEQNTSNDSASNPTTIVSSADLSIVKTPPTSLVPGTNAVFTITVSNAGSSDAKNVVVSDITPAGLTFVSNALDCTTAFDCNLNIVPAGTSRTITATYSVPANFVGTSVSNTATVSSSTPDPTPGNNSSTATVNAAPSSDLTVLKAGAATITPGLTAVYTVTVTNNGTSDAQNVVVADLTPTGLTFASNAGGCATAYPCNFATMAAGASKVITSTYNVPAGHTTASTTNTASVTSSTPDPTPGNNVSSVSSTLVARSDLSLTKVLTNPTPNLAGNANYMITLNNAGPSAAQNVSVNDKLPAGLTFVSSNPSLGTYNSSTGDWALGTVPVGTQTLELVATVIANTIITNSAQVTASDTPDPDSAPNDDTGDEFSGVSFTPTSPDLTIAKSHTPEPMTRGSSGTYTLTATNAGTGFTTAAVTVSDTLPAGLTPGAATGTGWTCTTTGQAVSCRRSDVLNAG